MSNVFRIPAVVFLALCIGFSVSPVSAQRVGTQVTASCADWATTDTSIKSAQCIPTTQPCTKADQIIGQGTCQDGFFCCATTFTTDSCQAAAKRAGGPSQDGSCITSVLCTEQNGSAIPGVNCGAGFVCCSLSPTRSTTPTGYYNAYGYQPPLGSATIPQIIAGFLAYILPLVGSLFFIMFLWGGVQWMTAGGDAKKLTASRSTLVNAAIGIAIVIFAYAIVSQVIAVLRVAG